MNPKFWLSIAFLMSRIGVFQAAGQCQPAAEYSIRGMFLRGHTFKTYKIEWHESCYFRCAEEVTCQSYNFVIGQNLCELNNRTKEARPEDFKPDQTRFYMKLAKNRGTLQFFFLVCLSFTNAAILNANLCFGCKQFVLAVNLSMEAGKPPGDWGVVKMRFFPLGFSSLVIGSAFETKHSNTKSQEQRTYTFVQN